MFIFFVFKQKTAYDMRISDWISDVCSSDLLRSKINLGPTILRDRRRIPNSVPVCYSFCDLGLKAARIGLVQFLPADGFRPVILSRECSIHIMVVDVASLLCEARCRVIDDVDRRDRKSTRMNYSHSCAYRMPSYA